MADFVPGKWHRGIIAGSRGECIIDPRSYRWRIESCMRFWIKYSERSAHSIGLPDSWFLDLVCDLAQFQYLRHRRLGAFEVVALRAKDSTRFFVAGRWVCRAAFPRGG